MANYHGGVMSEEVMNRIFANTTPREFDYLPGRTLEIPVEGGGKILLTGEVFKLRPSFSAEWFPVTPKPDEVVLNKAALVRGSEFLGEVHGSGSAQATNSAVGICVPPVGAFVFALKPFEGAVQGVVEFGEARFKMDGYSYTLFSATPITGGQQPREIWVYRSQNCPPSWGPASQTPQMIGCRQPFERPGHAAKVEGASRKKGRLRLERGPSSHRPGPGVGGQVDNLMAGERI